MLMGGRSEHGDRGDERPLRSRATRATVLAVVTACVGAGAFGAVVQAARPAPGCQPGSNPPGQQYGGPPGHQYGGPPGHQYGGPPGHQYGGPPGPQPPRQPHPHVVSSAVAAPRPRRLPPLLRSAEWLVAGGVVALLLGLAFRDGGFFPDTWNIGTLLLLWVVVVVLVARRHVVLGRLDATLLAGMAGLTLWSLLSAAWSLAPALSLVEGERTLLYFACVAALLLVFSSRNIQAAAVGTCGSGTVVCAYPLIDRLVAANAPPSGRLGGPVGYWNVLGVLAAAGACLAVALISHERRPAARAAAGCAVPILVGALYLTFSRGSWLALVIGLAVMAATDARRREFAGAIAAVALPAGAVVACGALAHALTTPTAPEAAVTPDAHRYAVAVLLASAASAGLAALAPRVAARLPALPVRRVAAATLACALVVAVVAAGGPRSLLDRASRAFDAAPPSSAASLNTHVISLSGTVRGELWRVAAASFADRPLAVNGAGTYRRLWLMKRRDPVTMQDAHSLYLETLAEPGGGGLGRPARGRP